MNDDHISLKRITKRWLQETNRMKKMLASEFELKDVEKLRYFLAIEMVRPTTGLIFKQRKYTLNLLKKTTKLGCRYVATPIEVNRKTNIKEGNHLIKEEKDKYQRLVGKLIYLILAKSDITYTINITSQFMYAPTNIHFVV